MRKLLFLFLVAAAAHAQISPRPADAIVPVVGSTRGQSNANFKTELQLANPTGGVMSGWLYLRPQGNVLAYELAAHTTRSFGDVVAELGASGLGSLDVLVERGGLPSIVARAYDDQPTGTTGATIPALPSSAILIRNDVAALIAPADFARYRFNAGIRTLDSGATLEIVVRAANGDERIRRTVTFVTNYFAQQTGDAFAGIALHAADSVEITITAGSAIVYGSTVDNQTNDSSVQVLRK